MQNALKINDIDVMAPLCDDLFSSYAVSGEYYKITELAPAVIELLEESKRESEFFVPVSFMVGNNSDGNCSRTGSRFFSWPGLAGAE